MEREGGVGRPGVQGGLEVVKGIRPRAGAQAGGSGRLRPGLGCSLHRGHCLPPQEPATIEGPLAEHTACRKASPKSGAPCRIVNTQGPGLTLKLGKPHFWDRPWVSELLPDCS